MLGQVVDALSLETFKIKVDVTEQPDLDRTSLLFYSCSASCHEEQLFVQRTGESTGPTIKASSWLLSLGMSFSTGRITSIASSCYPSR